MSNASKLTACPACGFNRQELLDLIDEALAALALCLECDGLTWEAEQEANAVHRKLGQVPR